MIDRVWVADVLAVDEASLPPGDLPIARLAERYAAYLRESYETDDAGAHPEFWTFVIASELVRQKPQEAAVLLEALCQIARDGDELGLLVVGPLEDYIAAHGEVALEMIERHAARSDRFRLALTGVSPDGSAGTPLWQRIRLLQEDAQDLVASETYPTH